MKVIDLEKGIYTRTNPYGWIFTTKEIEGEEIGENEIFIDPKFVRHWRKWLNSDEMEFYRAKVIELRSRIEWEEAIVEKFTYDD